MQLAVANNKKRIAFVLVIALLFCALLGFHNDVAAGLERDACDSSCSVFTPPDAGFVGVAREEVVQFIHAEETVLSSVHMALLRRQVSREQSVNLFKSVVGILLLMPIFLRRFHQFLYTQFRSIENSHFVTITYIHSLDGQKA